MQPVWVNRSDQRGEPDGRTLRSAQVKFIFHAFLVFFIFSILVAPLEYHFHWIHTWAQTQFGSLSEALLHPLLSGLLYFYSLIVAIEALSVLATYPDVVAHVRGMYWVMWFLGVPIFMFLFFYMASGNYPTPWNSPRPTTIPDLALTLQWVTAVVALALSLVVHLAAIRFESRRKLYHD